jgi:transcriptional regulator with XRE-family HTH domain
MRGIGWAIRKVRKAQKRTLVELAAAIGSDAGNLSRIEKGTQNATEETLLAISRELGVPMSDLWRLAETGSEDAGTSLAKIGQLDDDGLRDLEPFVDFLLSQQKPNKP